MAYGFDALYSKKSNTVTLMHTHDGKHVGETVLAVNDTPVSSLNGAFNALITIIERKKEEVIFLLSGGDKITFLPDSVPDEVWFQSYELPEWIGMTKGGLEALEDGQTIVATPPRPGTQALHRAFPH